MNRDAWEEAVYAHGIKKASMDKFYRHSRILLTISIAGFGALAIWVLLHTH